MGANQPSEDAVVQCLLSTQAAIAVAIGMNHGITFRACSN
jgi:hypothetical protein